jgi:hypothetical protein
MAEIVDRVLDRGIVIDYRGLVSIGGIDALVGVDARYVVTSIQTDLDYAWAVPPPVRHSAEPRPWFDSPAATFYWAWDAAAGTRSMRRKSRAR